MRNDGLGKRNLFFGDEDDLDKMLTRFNNSDTLPVPVNSAGNSLTPAMHVVSQVARAESALAAQWLAERQPNEKHFEASFTVKKREGGCLFGKTEAIFMSMSVKTW